jgi:tetraacyldisaccharide-1-P 4'-kinase
MTEAAETYLLAVILENLPGRKASLIRALLSMLSQVFAVIVKLRRLLYSVRILRDSTLGVQVIAVGNLTVGGTGKTPVVEKFARALQDAGRKVAILSRGYRSCCEKTPRRRESSPTVIPCFSIRRPPVTNPTCWRPTSGMWWCWSTKTG